MLPLKKVFVGLSGGVDSAVSAALLKGQGYDVVGAFIKIWQPEFIECTWKKDRLDAMRVCAALDIPFKEVDLSDEYKNHVIEDMIQGYERGITPNPDVLCNSRIKFGSFAKWAHEEGADFVATGHYARIKKYGHGVSIFRGIDPNKDQSYFLWQLAERDLETTLFPIGDMRKSDVRAKATELGLPVAKKPDSQGLCFVGDITMSDFLKRYIRLTSGAILDESGNEIGMHDGSALFTLGQRHGFTVQTQNSNGQPLYVIRIDIAANTITVSPNRSHAKRRSVMVREVNMPSNTPITFTADAQVRYRELPVSAHIRRKENTLDVLFDTPCIAAPGQSVVFYEGERLIGGGIIE